MQTVLKIWGTQPFLKFRSNTRQVARPKFSTGPARNSRIQIPLAGQVYVSDEAGLPDLAGKGASIFESNCAKCHYVDSSETKIGPGLKGLYSRDKMPVSERRVSDTDVRRQLKTPFDKMPPFPRLSEDDIQALLAYLKTL
jgi:cytochrome c